MSDIRAGLKDLNFFAKHMKGIIEMVPYLEDASRLESEVTQNKARNQKLQVEIKDMKQAVADYQSDLEGIVEAGKEASLKAKEDYDEVINTAVTQSNKIIAASNAKIVELKAAHAQKDKNVEHHIEQQEKKLANINKQIAKKNTDLAKVQTAIARLKEGL